MSTDVIRLLVLALVFAAVVLGIEGGMRWYRTSRGSAMAVNKRLRLIASGFDRPEVLARLRRDTWGDAIRLPGFSTTFSPAPIVTLSGWRVLMPTFTRTFGWE